MDAKPPRISRLLPASGPSRLVTWRPRNQDRIAGARGWQVRALAAPGRRNALRDAVWRGGLPRDKARRSEGFAAAHRAPAAPRRSGGDEAHATQRGER